MTNLVKLDSLFFFSNGVIQLITNRQTDATQVTGAVMQFSVKYLKIQNKIASSATTVITEYGKGRMCMLKATDFLLIKLFLHARDLQ